MSNVATLIRERTDFIVRAELLKSENAKLRDKLAELAKECAECNGTGCVDVLHRGVNNRLHSVSEDCKACLDIRELLQ